MNFYVFPKLLNRMPLCEPCHNTYYAQAVTLTADELNKLRAKIFAERKALAEAERQAEPEQEQIPSRPQRARQKRSKRRSATSCPCGSIECLVVHHIDWHHDNDRPSNRITLCHRCHVLVHKQGYMSRDEIIEFCAKIAENSPGRFQACPQLSLF